MHIQSGHFKTYFILAKQQRLQKSVQLAPMDKAVDVIIKRHIIDLSPLKYSGDLILYRAKKKDKAKST